MARIIVIGGGITGVTGAYALALDGHEVTLVERQRYAGMETSHANGGQLSASNAETWTHPTTLMQGIQWIFKPDAPLLVNPRPSWHKLSWFAEFAASIRKYRENTTETARLAIAAREYLLGWARDEGIDFNHSERGILHIYRDKAGFDHAAMVTELLAAGGLERRAVTPEEMRQIEPTLQGSYYGGFFTESDSTGDIHKLTHGLSQACRRRGVRLLAGRAVNTVRNINDEVLVYLSDGEVLQADAVVVSAGVHSRRIASQLGDRLNIYPVKGYSITVMLDDEASQAGAPEVSLLDDETKLVTARLGPDRFRVAGTAEFNGYNLDIRADRIRPLVDWVAECFPDVSTRRFEPWAGLRPMMPDMMPRVGPGRAPNVFYNTGHGHLGWTLSGITAHQLAEHVRAWDESRRTQVGALAPAA